MKINELLNNQDIQQITNHGITLENIQKQLDILKNGLQEIQLYQPATIENKGIKSLSEQNKNHYIKQFYKYKNQKEIVKFVPASGAATRMFKDLYEFLSTKKNNEKIQYLIENIEKLALYDDLNNLIPVKKFIEKKDFSYVIEHIITEKGLNYGNLPKALIKFHKYPDENRTAFEEHLTEATLYAKSNSNVKIHFTVSKEHKERFIDHEKNIINKYEQRFHLNYNIQYSLQLPQTDSLAFNPDLTPFRLNDGKLFFRPGGHGALIHNLNSLNANLIFIKNIDNVVPDSLKKITCDYKKVLAGILLETQQKIFQFINQLIHFPSTETILTAFEFLHSFLNIKTLFNFSDLTKTEKIEFLLNKLDRPLRVCGMVKSDENPGGGPFFVKQKDNTISLQIVESAQVNLNNPEVKNLFNQATHFNPVDIVLSPYRYNGEKFDLLQFTDPQTSLIIQKNKNGKSLIATELPGLWNGSMANWNTVFIEIPAITFNPVKTILDLFNKNHLN